MDKIKIKKLGILLEGERSEVYNDATGQPVHLDKGDLTVGIGRDLEKKPLSDDEINFLFEKDIDYFIERLGNLFSFWNQLDEVRQVVLIFTAFNVGVNGLLKFIHTIPLIEKKQWKAAHDEYLNCPAAQKDPRRYNILSNMLLTGRWPKECL